MSRDTADATFMGFDELQSAIALVLAAKGCSARTARILAENCASAQRDGSTSHGLFRLPDYVSTLRSGWVDGNAIPEVEGEGPAVVRVNARNGFAQPALAHAADLAAEKARSQGIAILCIRDSHHLGALYLDVEPFASGGLVALSVVTSVAKVAAPGARMPVYGTNPMAFASPRASGPPVVFDQASSVIAHGDVRLAKQEGRLLDEGVGIDSQGIPTRDPDAVLQGGSLLTFGGYKGASIALMVEILCAAVAGSNFSFEVDLRTHPGARSARAGQTILLLDPSIEAEGLPVFAHRVEALLGKVADSGQPRLPGDRRLIKRAEASRLGIPLTQSELALLEGARRP